MSSSFAIKNIQFGNTLTNIRNDTAQRKNSVVVRSSTTLTVDQFLNCINYGLIIDCNTGPVTVTTPSASEIISSLGLKKYSYFSMAITAVENLLVNGAIIQPGPGVSIATNVLPNLPILSQKTFFTTWTCYDTVTPKIILY